MEICKKFNFKAHRGFVYSLKIIDLVKDIEGQRFAVASIVFNILSS